MEFLNQNKLTKIEWCKIEQKIENTKEKEILKMINEGYLNENIESLPYICLNKFLNMNSDHDFYIFENLLKDKIYKLNLKDIFQINELKKMNESKNIKKASKSDIIKMNNSIKLLEKNNYENNIIEFIILSHLKSIQKIIQKQLDYIYDKKYGLFLYNIHILYETYVDSINIYFSKIISNILEIHLKNINSIMILENVSKYIEHNSIFKYTKYSLYDHQKDIYHIFKNYKNSKLIFYCAPTSSGKTLSPLGISNEYKVIFMCASKHIGLSLAKSGYFLNKKIGFAFGCKDVDNIRLNYNAINSYKDNKYGNKKIPDHNDGKKVEIMISDLISYEYAMNYMKAFNEINKIVLFWDEPTIGLDVYNHHLQDIISKNWKLNQIPNVVFSCATLPKEKELEILINNFKKKFDNAFVRYIESHDQKTNLMIYDDLGYILMPHIYFSEHQELCNFLNYHGKKYYKFYNCKECSKFLLFYHKEINSDFLNIHLGLNINNVNMDKIKDVYVTCLKQIEPSLWTTIKNMYLNKNINYSNDTIGCNLTTSDAQSLTNGPSLYISDNVDNICKYLLSISNIDKSILSVLNKKIEENSIISNELNKKRKDYEDKIEKYKENEKIMENMRLPINIIELNKEIQNLESNIKPLHLESIFKPNTRDHYQKWNKQPKILYDKADVFTSHIDDDYIKQIMELYSIPSLYKILLLMGIGVFTNEMKTNITNENNDSDTNKYLEIMKELAENKCLYLIIANSDYIYGTNYQFSHCYLGKDMKSITQEKIIQCIGRIGRQEKNKHFSFRFRFNKQIEEFYKIPKKSIEAENMIKLFS